MWSFFFLRLFDDFRKTPVCWDSRLIDLFGLCCILSSTLWTACSVTTDASLLVDFFCSILPVSRNRLTLCVQCFAKRWNVLLCPWTGHNKTLYRIIPVHKFILSATAKICYYYKGVGKRRKMLLLRWESNRTFTACRAGALTTRLRRSLSFFAYYYVLLCRHISIDTF